MTERRSATADALPAGHLRPGLRVYAIGDIHGHAELLDHMAKQVARDLALLPVPDALTVFIGDYIDRGPASADVIDRLVRGDFPTAIVTLRGNHEQMLLDGVDAAEAIGDWLWNGGTETAESYGLTPRRYADVFDFHDALKEALPASHLDFLRGTALNHSIDGYFFAHAGIQPGVPLAEQKAEDLLWIRKPFHVSTVDHGKVVVHGHTPVPRPESRPNRINIDTGAFRTGRLTCVVLDDGDRRFLST